MPVGQKRKSLHLHVLVRNKGKKTFKFLLKEISTWIRAALGSLQERPAIEMVFLKVAWL